MEATNGLVYGLDGALIPELPCGAGCPNGLVCGDQQLCTPPPPVGSCDNPEILVPFLTGRMSAFSADTSANISSTSGSCGQTDSPDHVFSLSITPYDCIGGDGSCPVCISTAPVRVSMKVATRRANFSMVHVPYGGESLRREPGLRLPASTALGPHSIQLFGFMNNPVLVTNWCVKVRLMLVLVGVLSPLI